jgi:threonine aldolase
VTNIVLFRPPEGWPVDAFVAAAESAGVALGGFGHGRVRAVTHADVSAADVERTVEILGKVLAGGPVPA